MDETSLSLQPPLRACWMKIGQQKRIPAGNHDTRCTLFGVYNWADGSVTTLPTQNVDSDAFILFLEEVLVNRYPTETVVWVMDNAAWHLSGLSRAALSLFEHRVQFIYLPPYCSHLNPIERFWRHLKDQATANTLYLTLEALLEAVNRTLTAQNDLTNSTRLHLCQHF